MTFLSSASEKSFLIMQRNHKKYEKNIMTLRFNMIKRNIEYVENQYYNMNSMNGTDEDALQVDDDPYYRSLQQMSDQIETQMEDLDVEIETFNAQIESFTKEISNGIKSSCGLSLNGG